MFFPAFLEGNFCMREGQSGMGNRPGICVGTTDIGDRDAKFGSGQVIGVLKKRLFEKRKDFNQWENLIIRWISHSDFFEPIPLLAHSPSDTPTFKFLKFFFWYRDLENWKLLELSNENVFYILFLFRLVLKYVWCLEIHDF